MKRLQLTSIIMILFLSVLSISCKDEEKNTANEAATTERPSSSEMKDNMAKSADMKYNPAHGVEGHRCDLPVGAPLEQARASNTNPEMTTSPVRMQSASPKINPPHGEPGHDCSVPVGGELN